MFEKFASDINSWAKSRDFAKLMIGTFDSAELWIRPLPAESGATPGWCQSPLECDLATIPSRGICHDEWFDWFVYLGRDHLKNRGRMIAAYIADVYDLAFEICPTILQDGQGAFAVGIRLAIESVRSLCFVAEKNFCAIDTWL